MMFDKIEVRVLKTIIRVNYGGKELAVIKKKILSDVAEDFLAHNNLDKEESTAASELMVKVGQFARAYNSAKKKYYHNSKLKPLNPTDREYKYLIEATKLIVKHKCTYRQFINAQIQGLSFVNNGKGHFPKPNQLVTPAAEDRLLDFLRDRTIQLGHTRVNVPTVEIDKEDRQLSLGQNIKYQDLKEKLKDKKASLMEALYVLELQKFHLGKPKKFVSDYVKESAAGR